MPHLYPSKYFKPADEATKMKPSDDCEICQFVPLPLVSLGPNILVLGLGFEDMKKECIVKINSKKMFFTQKYLLQR